METNDYKNFDKITLYVKSNKTESIIQHYADFGWKICNKIENKKYADLVDLTFTRPHKIKNKDELQLLQVYLEEKLNAVGKAEKDKHAKTMAFGLCFGPLGLLFLLFGFLVNFNIIVNLDLVFGISFSILGGILLISAGIILPKLFKHEKLIFAKKQILIEKQIQNICDKALLLRGESNE